MGIPNMPPEQTKNAVMEGVSGMTEEMLKQALQTTRELNVETRVTVAESVFNEFFLPALNGAKGSLENLNKWSALVNGFLNWVNVVNDEGVVLFEVPPLFNTNTLDARAPRDPMMPTISNVIDMAIQNTRNRRLQRHTEIHERTLDVLKHKFALNPDSALVVAWKKIYDFYGIEFTGKIGIDHKEDAPEVQGTESNAGSFVEKETF